MKLQKLIVISAQDFQKEVSASSFVGTERMVNLNTSDKPGAVYPNIVPVKHSGTNVTDLILWMKSLDSEHWAVDEAGNVYDISGTTYTKRTGHSSNNGQGLEIYKGFVLLMTGNSIEALDLSDNSWDTTWQSLTSASYHPSLVGQDDIVYIGNANYIATLEEVSGQNFDSGSATTYSYDADALDLPEGYIVNCLAELGSYLAIGAYRAYDENSAAIFLWDRSSPSFDNVIKLSEDKVNQMITVNNILYVQAGGFGKWYRTNGTIIELFAKLPKSFVNITGSTGMIFNPGAVTYWNNLIYFGFVSDTSTIPFGVFSLNPNTGQIELEYTISTGTIEDNNTKKIGALMPRGGSLNICWEDNSTYGVDRVAVSGTAYTSDNAYMVSRVYQVGMPLNKVTLQGINIILSKPLSTGDSVKAYYREATNGSWTQIGSTFTSGQFLNASFAPSVANIQFKIVLNNTAEMLRFEAY